MSKSQTGFIILITTAIISIIALLITGPIYQDVQYHNFSDFRTITDIPNFWNVVSNFPFLIIGGLGLVITPVTPSKYAGYTIFFSGVFLVAFGSAYYHFQPDNNTLIWDRLPITIAFMALFSIIIFEFLSKKYAQLSLVTLVSVGIFSVIYWVVTGDLRLYTFIQFYPMIAISVILIFFQSDYTGAGTYWTLLILYGVAKVFEVFDAETSEMLGFLSGHTLKHFFAALGLYMLWDSYRKREIIADNK